MEKDNIKPRDRSQKGHQRRQQRRKSKAVKQAQQLQQKRSVPISEINETYRRPTAKPKSEFVEEEKEIQAVIKELPNEQKRVTQDELEIMFFTTGLPESSIEVLHTKTVDDARDTGSQKTSDSIKSATVTHESPTHLASSYLPGEEMTPTTRFIPRDVEYNDDLLYYPALEEEVNLETIEARLPVSKDDGIYIGKTREILPQNRAQMINRCLEESNLDALKLVEKPVCDLVMESPSPGLFRSFSSKKFHTVFFEPEPLSSRTLTLDSVEKILNISISTVHFENHPSLTETSMQVKKLKDLYGQYSSNTLQGEVKRLESKLEGLRHLKEQVRSDDSKLEACRSQIIETRTKLHAEAQTLKDLTVQILETWRHLKRLQVEKSSKALDFSLTIHCRDGNVEEKQIEWDEKFEIEFEEILEEKLEEYQQERAEYKHQLKDKKGERVEKPKKPDPDTIRETLLNTWNNSFRQPEEPEITIEMTTASTEDGLKLHQKGVTGFKYFCKITADGQLITITKSKEVRNDFTVLIDSTVAVKFMTHMVREVKVEICEVSELRTTSKVADIFVIIPSGDEYFSEMSYEDYEFTSKKNLKGYRTSGIVKVKIGWLADDLNQDQASGSSQCELQKRSGTVISKDTLKTWHQQHLIDPLDPDAHAVFERMISSQSTIEADGEQKFFNLNEDDLCFCSKEEIDNDERLNMLIARWNRDMKFRNVSFVPSNKREVEMPENKSMFDEIAGDPIDLERFEGKKYLKKVYEIITNHCENLNASREQSAILIGDQVPTFGSLSLTFFEIFGAKRPLKPTRRSPSSSKSGRTVDLCGESFNIVVTIVRAFGVPQRNEDISDARRNSNLSNTNKSLKNGNVRPYVTVSIKEKSVRTCTAEGFNPTWNEQLALPVSSKTGFTKNALSVDLFDECIEDYMADDRRITEVYQRWLGQLQFPLEAIYQNQRIEGTFEMTTPMFLLGYNRQNFGTTPENAGSSLTNVGYPNMREVTYLSLFINLEPQPEPVRPLTTRGLECIELEETRTYIDTWYLELRREFPWRCQSPYVVLLNGKKTCVTRLLGSLEVPPFDVPTDNLEYFIRRFVSLIPIYNTFNPCIGLDGVWLLNEEIFKVICASPKDLGVLLTCYYLALNKTVWLILGSALPVGDTCFVLLKEENEYFIIDPTTGKKYDSNAVDCPLKKVHALANADNYWANIQREKRVFMTRFDVKNGTEWRSLFKWSRKAPTGFLQNGAFQYRKSSDVYELQRIIELKLMKKISTWRSHRRTTWNRYISEQLRKVLVDLEHEQTLNLPTADKHLLMINKLFTNYKVTGYPLNFRYTNLSTIVNHVKCTGIHLNSETAEFGVAAYIKDYANNILSVWIFVVSMVSK